MNQKTLTQTDILKLVTFAKQSLLSQCEENDFSEYFAKRHHLNNIHIDEWRIICDSVDNDELILLFKGLILAECRFGLKGGSVASAISIYRIISDRSLDLTGEIANWALNNTNNNYVPFGTSNYGQRSIAELKFFKAEKARVTALKADTYEKVLKRVKGRKVKRAAEIANLRNLGYDERRMILQELEDMHSDKSIEQKLTIIATDDFYPPEYYPVTWIDFPCEQIKDLPTELVKRLVDKLSTKSRGKWKRFVEVLKQFDDGI